MGGPAAAAERAEGIMETLQKQALPDLINSLTDKKPGRRLRLVRVTGDLHDHRAAQYLLRAYEETEEEGVRCKLLESMGKLHDPTLLSWYFRRLKDPSIGIRCFAIWALGELGTSQAIDPLRRMLWSKNPFVRMTTINALGKTGQNPPLAFELEVLLRDEDVQIRFLTAKALRGLAGPDSAPELIDRLLQEADPDVQEALARTAGTTGGGVAAGHFIELLKNSPSQDTEHWAEAGLAAGPRDIVIPALTPLLKTGDFRLRLSASRVLAELERNNQP